MRIAFLSLAVAAATASAAAVAIVPAQADETGMAGMHSWRKVGRKTCLSGHQHDGSGSGPNRKVAEWQAIRSWAGFTELEYGSTWANFGNAIEKRMTCSGSPGSVHCDLLATPCRPF